MTLKEKFSTLLPFYNVNDNNNKSIQCENIADDYAIDFAMWLFDKDFYKSVSFEDDRLFLSKSEKYLDGSNKIYFCDELLEIFKKEKGL